MSKVRGLAAIYTLILALPFTLAAACVLIYLTDYIRGVGGAMASVIDWNRLAVEGLARWPEIAGLVAGQLVILSILLIARRDHQHDDDHLIDPEEQIDESRTTDHLETSTHHAPPRDSSHLLP